MYYREHPDWLHHSVVRELHSQGSRGPTQFGQVCRVHHRQGAPSPAGHLPDTMPQESWQDPKRLLSSSLQTFYSAAFWKAVPQHPVSHTQTGEQFLPESHQAAKWTLTHYRHFGTRHLHTLSLTYTVTFKLLLVLTLTYCLLHDKYIFIRIISLPATPICL